MSDFLTKVINGHPVQTRDGRPAKFIAHVTEARGDQRLIFLVECNISTHSDDGSHWSFESPNDIILAPEPPRVLFDRWVRVHKGNGSILNDTIFVSESIAQCDSPALYTAHLRFWSDGRVEQIKD